jgi:hypothetical protein
MSHIFECGSRKNKRGIGGLGFDVVFEVEYSVCGLGKVTPECCLE